MSYNPKIYIRDYGVPTRRFLAYWRGFELAFFDSAFRRDLIIHAENPNIGEEFLLLSGDEQSGSDLLDLSGTGNELLVLSNTNTLRWFGTDVALQYSNISGFPSWLYELTPFDVGLIRSLIIPTTVDIFALTGSDAGLLRSLPMAADVASFAMTGQGAALTRSLLMGASVGAYSVAASNAGLLRSLPMAAAASSYAITGNAAGLSRSLIMGASSASFVATFIAANISNDNFELLSGDAQSGSDVMLVSGDAQTGTDFLLISQ